MRNKGFFWFLTILLTAVCVYQLSFTWVSNSVERKAEKEAKRIVEKLMRDTPEGDSAALPNDTYVTFNEPEHKDIAIAAYINDILKTKAETSVYPVIGSTFKEAKARSLAFGLDLVGGMSVTMEISVPEMIKSFTKNPRDLDFRKAFDAAKNEYDREGGDFVAIFVNKHRKLNPGVKLVDLFAYAEMEGLAVNSSDEDIIKFLKDKETGSMEGVENIMNRRINQFGVAQPNIQKDPANNRLYIELPGVQDDATVSEKLQSTANLQFFQVVPAHELGRVWEEIVILSGSKEKSFDELESESDSTNIDSTKVSEELSLEDFSDLNGGEKGLKELVAVIGGYGPLGFVSSENKSEVTKLLNRQDIRKKLESISAVPMWSAEMEKNNQTKRLEYVLYMIKVPQNGKARVGGKDIENAQRGYDTEKGLVTVDLKMTVEGSDKWARMTEEMANASKTGNYTEFIAITMDSLVYSAPTVRERISGGRTEISGNFTVASAQDLASLLNGGALPAPCVIKEQTKVGPTIGADNAKSGLISFGIALLLVFAYMIFYYGKGGVVADIALIANILFIFGALASFGAVLTLAGIAGIVLTIGMAVDANVLIFERIREEQIQGKDLKSAVDTGFSKALSSIIDANVTTLLTAIVLKIFGSGPIESFATTLIIGIFTSVFAALVITRLTINWMLNKGKTMNFESKVTKNAFRNFNFDFVGKRKMYYIFSGLLVAGGIISLVTKGLNPSVEFSGGRTFGVKFDNSAKEHIDYVQSNLKSVMTENGVPASVELKTKSSNYYLEISTNYLMSRENGTRDVQAKLKEGLDKCKDKLGAYRIDESRSVSASVSKELISSSTIAIILSLLIIFTYILIRFGKWQYSTGAILAMLHDVIIVLSVFSIFHGILPFNMDIDQAFIAAILTVIGYSINDTVIIFDRIRENLGLHKSAEEKDNINKSLNTTLSRTINTSMTTFMVLLIIFLFGGAAIKGFIFALMIGVIVGTYSSICIATPLLIDLSKTLKRD